MKRRRGTAIVEFDEGILLTGTKGDFLLPGGGAEKGESRFRASIRELEEETGLMANSAKIIFRHESNNNFHTVVLINAKGKPKPKNEVRRVRYYKPNKKLKLSKGCQKIINKYYEWKNQNI